MSNDELINLRKEVASLRAELAKFQLMVMAESQVTTEHLSAQYREISDIQSYLMPLIRRFFPQIGKSEKKLNAILKREPADQQQRSRKNRYNEILEGLKRDPFAPPKPVRDGDYG